MSARSLVPLTILAGGPLALLLAWPLAADWLRLSDLAVSVVTQPHHEVLVTGTLKNAGATAYSIETLSVEEPDKEAYPRLVSLDAEHKFTLALGKPVAGTYRIAAKTRKQTWLSGAREGWLRTPALVVLEDKLHEPRQVRAQDFDYEHMLLFGSLIVAAQLAGLIIWYRLPRRAQAPVPAAAEGSSG